MWRLDPKEISFPDPSRYHPEDGLLAVGGDLSPERVWWAYQLGIFPWYNPGEEILWWCPDPRFVLRPEELIISRSMEKILKAETFSITENKCFEKVIQSCQKIQRKNQEGTWITQEMLFCFLQLHQEGKAKSVEVWQRGELVGGFYGIDLGNVFCGESMFSKVSNASKAGFIWFVQQYKKRYQLIDCQVYTPHLESLGAKHLAKKSFLKHLNQYNPTKKE